MNENKNIVVFGASGEVGKQVVEQALLRGHYVTAVVRSTQSLSTLRNDRLSIKQGDVTEREFVSSCVDGHHVVISCLGPRITSIAPWGSPINPDFLLKAVNNIIHAMKSHHVTRILVVSVAGTGDSWQQVGRAVKALLSVTALRKLRKYWNAMEQAYLNETDTLDVCLVRPPTLTNKQPTHQVKVVQSMKTATVPEVSRADLAYWMLEEFEKSSKFAQRTALVM